MQTDRQTGRWTEGNWIFSKALSSTESERQRQGKRERQTGRETDKQTETEKGKNRARERNSQALRDLCRKGTRVCVSFGFQLAQFLMSFPT